MGHLLTADLVVGNVRLTQFSSAESRPDSRAVKGVYRLPRGEKDHPLTSTHMHIADFDPEERYVHYVNYRIGQIADIALLRSYSTRSTYVRGYKPSGFVMHLKWGAIPPSVRERIW